MGANMQLRVLGRSGLRVSPLCLGGNVFGWTANEAASFQVLDALVSAGLNFVDTADVYSVWVPGHRASVPRAAARRRELLRARLGISQRKVPYARGRGEERARTGGGREVPE